MPAESLRWETLEALKNSPKGKLKYSPDWLEKDEDILAGCNEVISLSPLSGQVLNKLSSQTESTRRSLPGSPFREEGPPTNGVRPSSDVITLHSTFSFPRSTSSSSLQSIVEVQNMVYEDKKESSTSTLNQSSTSPPAISLLSPRVTQMAGCIRICEKKQQDKVKAELSMRQEMQERLVATLASRDLEQLKRFEESVELKQRQEDQSIRDMWEKETQESLGRQEKLKEEHRHRMKIMNSRLREAKQQAELEQQKKLEGEERLRTLNAIQEEVLRLNKLLDPSSSSQQEPSLDYTPYVTRGNQLCSQVSEVIHATADGRFPSTEDMTVAEQAQHQMRMLLSSMRKAEEEKARERKRKEQEEEEARKKEEDLKAKQEEQKKSAVAQAVPERTKKGGLQTQATENTLKWYRELQDFATQFVQTLEDLNSSKDSQTKKLRMELTRAASTPINQISGVSASKLKEIIDKIDRLLSGQTVVISGSSISTSQHPHGLEFVTYKLAEKFVNRGAEDTDHMAAFSIAVVVSGIWELHPNVGKLFLAHLHTKCPYAVPHYPPMKSGTSVEDYQKILGYTVSDSKVEQQDSFLRRMSGMIRLYAAIIQLRRPCNNKQGDVHGLNHGWRWLTQMLNMEPCPDITATVLVNFLEVCGNALMKQYQGQFWKLLLLIKEEYFPRIKAVTSNAEMGSVARLKEFLEKTFRNGRIDPPEGQLSLRS